MYIISAEPKLKCLAEILCIELLFLVPRSLGTVSKCVFSNCIVSSCLVIGIPVIIRVVSLIILRSCILSALS